MSQHPPPDRKFPLAEVVSHFLMKGKGPEPLFFAPQGQDAVRVGLDALFSSGLPPVPALEELLGLAYILETDRESPSAAGLIREVVRNHPKAMAALGLTRMDTAALRRGAARLTGGNTQDRAPVYGSAAPQGSLRAAAVIDPLSLDRSRSGGRVPAPSRTAAPLVKAPTPKGAKPRRSFDVG